MNEFKQQHLEKKNAVINCLKEAEEFFVKHEYSHEAEMIAKQRENLENGEFSIAIVGEFSAGKSTFLNALMEKRILPSFTRETTATINFLRHKDRAKHGEGGCVYYNDGSREDIANTDIATISKYVSTESTEMDVAKSVSHLDLFLDSKFLENNVTLVDTPGLNGIREGHEVLTKEQIEKSSASVFLFDANKPGSRSDFEFLSELRKRVKSIIFVLNKIDNIKTSEGESVESVIAKLKENYKKQYPDVETVPEIWPVAAYPALVARENENMDFRGKSEFTREEKIEFEKLSRMREFEDRLWKFLTQGEKAKQELLAPVTQLIEDLKDIRNKKNVEHEGLLGKIDFDEVESQRIELEKHLHELQEQLNAKSREMKEKIKYAEHEFKEEVNSESERSKKRIAGLIDNFVDLDDIEPSNIERRLKNDLAKIGKDAYMHYCEQIQSIQEEYACEVTDELNDSLSASLNVQLDKTLDIAQFSVGIEQYEKEEENLRKEIKKLQEEAEKSEDDYLNVMKLTSERQELERALEKKRELRDMYEQNSMTCIPSVKMSEEVEDTWVKRKGLGSILNIFDGGKHQLRTKTVCDSKDRDEYLRNRNAILERENKEIQEIEQDIKRKVITDPQMAERMAKRKEEAVAEKRRELEAFQVSFSEKLKKTNAMQLKRQKSEMNKYADELTEDFIEQCKDFFRKHRDAQANMMLDIINRSITKNIKLKQDELDLLIKQKETAITERDDMIKKIEIEMEEIKSILNEALGIESDINDIEVDYISEEQI